MKQKSTGSSVELPIDRLSPKGNGIGQTVRSDGSERIVEVPFAIPGDTVRATVVKKKHGKEKARLEEVLSPSAERVQPLCKHFGVCGGCRLQQMSYESQLQYKEAFVRKLFQEIAVPGVEIKPIVPSVSPWQYRNKMEYSFSSDLNGTRYLGLVMEGSKGKVLNLTECHLVAPWYTECLDTVRQWWESTDLQAYHPYKNTGTMRTLIVREGVRTGDRLVMLTVSGNPDYAPKKQQLNSFVSSLRNAIELHDGKSRLSIFLRIQQIAPGMATNFYEMLLYGPDVVREEMHIQLYSDQPAKTLQFKISPASFFQPNPLQAEKLYSLALQTAQLKPQDVVYDLYCGTGTIGISAASSVKEVIGIEVSPEAALDARENAKLNGLTNVNIFAGAVHHILQQIQKDRHESTPDVVIVDPPRVGMENVGQRLIAGLNAERVLYISCNPSTMVADITVLTSLGYKLISLQPVDMFPQTMHIETIALLVRQ
ncbi:MAG: 23S rRNA (uracil(1939)-C(5))-methyltransferase RlmD [Parachlamydiales bacterium]|jgi:23S rRNA (uracil-5-)-methyltransferase RumA